MEKDERRLNRIVNIMFLLAVMSILAYIVYRDIMKEEMQQESLAAVRDKWADSKVEDR